MSIHELVQGLVNGSVYGLMAIGLVLILNTTGVANFGHVDMGLLPAFVALTLMSSGLSMAAAIPIAVAIGAALGLAAYLLVFAPMRGAPHFAVFLASFVVGGLLNVTVQYFWGPDVRPFPRIVGGYVSWLPGGVAWTSLIVVGAGVGCLVLVNALIHRTRLGLSLRAQSQDPLAAQLMGMSERLSGALVWALGAALSVVAVVLAGPTSFLGLATFAPILLKAFAGAVIGGVNNLWAAYFGSLMLGLVEIVIGSVLPSHLLSLRDALALVVLVAVLWLRPQGLFVRATAVRVA